MELNLFSWNFSNLSSQISYRNFLHLSTFFQNKLSPHLQEDKWKIYSLLCLSNKILLAGVNCCCWKDYHKNLPLYLEFKIWNVYLYTLDNLTSSLWTLYQVFFLLIFVFIHHRPHHRNFLVLFYQHLKHLGLLRYKIGHLRISSFLP